MRRCAGEEDEEMCSGGGMGDVGRGWRGVWGMGKWRGEINYHLARSRLIVDSLSIR